MRGQKIVLFLLLFSFTSINAQKKILHYSETGGYDHQTRANSLAMFQQFGTNYNFVITNDVDGSNFNSLSNLQQFDLIVFSNTSGNTILDSIQKSNFENYINNGGALIGIHAATDTYRHSTANGNLTGSWDFYPETIGGSVQENPNHVVGTPNYAISKVSNHPMITSLPNPWMKNEEYYYWENGYLDSNNVDLLKVENTIGPNNLVNSYDSSRTVSWYKISANNSRVFYTSLGHSNSDFTTDTLFKNLILNATKWCLNLSISLFECKKSVLNIFPIPANENIYLEGENLRGNYIIHNITGKIEKYGEIDVTDRFVIDISNLSRGIYFIKYYSGGNTIVEKIIVQ